MGCTSLTNATILGCSASSDHDGIFADCTNLMTVTIGDGVTLLNKAMFKNCANLESVAIGRGVTNLPVSLFQYCRNLRQITFEGNAPVVGTFAFSQVPADCMVYVHRGSTGWGVDIPGKWHGLNIEYIDTTLPDLEPSSRTDGARRSSLPDRLMRQRTRRVSRLTTRCTRASRFFVLMRMFRQRSMYSFMWMARRNVCGRLIGKREIATPR